MGEGGGDFLGPRKLSGGPAGVATDQNPDRLVGVETCIVNPLNPDNCVRDGTVDDEVIVGVVMAGR